MSCVVRNIALAIVLFGWPSQLLAQVDVRLSHSPPHPSADEQAWAIAKVVGGPFDRIRVDYDLYQVTAGSNLLFPEEVQIEQSKVVKTCGLPANSGTQWCFARLPQLPDNRLVRLRATALSPDGLEQDSESYFYANGTWPGGGPVPIRRSGPIEGRFDVVFVPDFPSLQSTDSDPEKALHAFVGGLTSVINTHIFGFEPYGGTLGNPYRRLYNFYYTRSSGRQINPTSTSGSCAASALPGEIATIDTHFDAAALLHCRSEDGTSGYSRSPGVSSPDACQRLHDYKCTGHKFMTSEMDYSKTLGHELGHLLYRLTDEYCGVTNYANAAAVHPNVFPSANACQAAAVGLGYEEEFCARICSPAQIQHTNKWKIDHPFEPSSIMDSRMHEVHSTFFNPTLTRILTEYVDCTDDNVCYNASFAGAVPDAPADVGPTAESMPITESIEATVASSGTPAPSPPVAEFSLRRVVNEGPTATAVEEPAQFDVAQSVSDLQELLKAPLKDIGRDAPAGARMFNNEVASEAPPVETEIGVEIDLNGLNAAIIGVEPVSPAQAPANQAAAPGTITVLGLDEDGDEVFRETVADPRWIEIEGQNWVHAEKGRLFLPLPQEGVARLIVRPDTRANVLQPGDARAAAAAPPADSELDLTGALRDACRQYGQAAACR